MKTVTLDVRSSSDAMTDFSHAWKRGKAQKSARISFTAPELVWQVLSAKRWELLKALCGAGSSFRSKRARSSFFFMPLSSLAKHEPVRIARMIGQQP